MIDQAAVGASKIYTWAPSSEIEESARKQLENVARLPWVFHHVAVMPDVHWGKGCTVGSVIAMRGAIAPAAVGVDIGCGMAAINLGLGAEQLPDNLEAIRRKIEQTIPVGFNSYAEPIEEGKDAVLFSEFGELDDRVQSLLGRAANQVGTLGGGNHFIELSVDTDGGVWLMLHSGSRNIGKSLAEIHIAKARELAHNADLPDRDLAVFLAGTPEMVAYRRDLFWAQRYALLNRRVMVSRLLAALGNLLPLNPGLDVYCHHNYVADETHFGERVLVTRKGAINAERGVLGIIPGSMGTKSYIVRGLGNPDSFNSASHGAGRRMSRGGAKRTFTVEDLAKQTAGVECRKDEGVLDEIPGAYKDIDRVIQQEADLVEVVVEMKQVLCVKG
ncbi:MAG: RtcB family protein [Patescibacteria group bacterium]|nr:RtcB family protein [Patescibacteria group bacterium]